MSHPITPGRSSSIPQGARNLVEQAELFRGAWRGTLWKIILD
jgi:hypothetical protein